MIKILVLLLLGIVRAIELKLIAPIEGNKWFTGQTVTVSWEAKNMGNLTQIDLDLVQGTPDNLLNNISFGVPVDLHSSEWIVDKGLADGDDYMVRITSAQDPKFRILGPRFSIARNKTKGASANHAPKPQKVAATHDYTLYSYLGLVLGFFLI